MAATMTPEQELHAIKVALWNWANSKTYDEGCRNWRRVCELVGFDVAANERVEKAKGQGD